MTEYLGWLANLLILVGLYRVGYKTRDAFAWTVAGESLWFASAVQRGLYDIAAICAVFGLMAIRNWWLWRPKP